MNFKRILLTGSNKLTAGIAVCLLEAGHEVSLYNPSGDELQPLILRHLQDLGRNDLFVNFSEGLSIGNYDLALCINQENLEEKQKLIARIERFVDADTPIGINTESISLDEITSGSNRIIGINWSEPAHTSFFLEIISSPSTKPELAQEIFTHAKQHWQKDPYLLKNGRGIRSRMLTALIREAFYLVENNYVRVEDIDRACRNDAGYYLPFAGNFRYMDLMGAFMYGVVMQDLNPELSKDKHIPAFCRELFQSGAKGMKSGKGFYEYEEGEAEEWDEKFRKFSYEIKDVISKYNHETVSEL